MAAMRPEVAVATQSLAAQRRRESQQQEAREQRKLVELLTRYLPDGTFWSSLENRPRSALSGLMQKRRGCRPGLPDLVLLHAGKLVAVEMKSRRGVASKVQREVAAAIQAAGGQWWLCRSARSAMVALHLSHIPFRFRWKPPRLAAWEGPTSNPWARLPQHPQIRREQRAALQRYRERKRAREIARRAEPSIPGTRDPRPAPGDAHA